jgi:leucyl aminopeptidase
MWALPLSEKAKEGLKGGYSDIVNTTRSSYAGTIEAAMFLNYFVEENTKWVHLDIAGPVVDSELPKKANQGIASGFPVKTLVDYIRNN